MAKKIIAVILSVLTILSLVLSLGGCNADNANYPVSVGRTKINSKPEKVAVLSDDLADIIYYMGYSTQISIISDECNQEELTKYIKSAGSETAPDIKAIASSGATLCLTDKELSAETVSALAEKNIEVINFMIPDTVDKLKTVYKSLGTIFGGKEDGAKNGQDSFDRLITTLDQAQKQVENSTVVKLVCYLYLDNNNTLCSFSSDTSEGMLLERLCATNVAANFTDNKVDVNILRLSNPDFIFYDNENVLNYVKSNKSLSSLTALKSNNTYMLPASSLGRHGKTMINTQNFILAKMFPNSVSENTGGESLASRYSVTLKEDMRYEVGSEHSDIKPIQQRLIDLGYLKLDEGDSATTYFGGMTAEAIKSFQTANGLSASGVADFETLDLLFMSTTLSTEGKPVVPGSSSVNSTEPSATEAPTQNQSGQTTGYNIDLTSQKSYSRGDENADIAVIQQRLVDLRYMSFDEGDTVTTTFGDGTEYAITLFQENNGLRATGVADYNTLKLLFSDDARTP